MKFKKGNIVKVNDKLGVVIDTEYMNQNTIRVATFKNPSYWGDDYNKDRVIYIMQGHPDLADQIRNMNSIEECINDYLTGQLNERGRYNLLRYIDVQHNGTRPGSPAVEAAYEKYKNLFNLIFNLQDMDMIRLWIDKNVPSTQDPDEILKGCVSLLEAVTKSKVI